MNRDNRRLRLVFALLVVAALTLLTLDLRGGNSGAFGGVRRALNSAFSPVQRGLSHVFSPVGDAFSAAFHAHRDQNKIDALERQLAALELERDKDATLKRDTPELQKLAQLNYFTKTKGVPAHVIGAGTPVQTFTSTVTLDIGTSSGVTTGLPVIDDAGLMGRVVRVTADSSIVLLIDDPGSTVQVDDGYGDLLADVTGRGQGQPLLYDQQQPAGKPPKNGATIVTAETSSYLQGIPVGTVSDVALSGTDEVGLLQPLAGVDSSKNVEVVLSQASNLPRGPLVPQSPPPTPKPTATTPPPSSPAATPGASGSPGPTPSAQTQAFVTQQQVTPRRTTQPQATRPATTPSRTPSPKTSPTKAASKPSKPAPTKSAKK